MTQASAHQWERVQSVASNPSHPDSYLAACLLELKKTVITKQQLRSSLRRHSVGVAEQPARPIASDDELELLFARSSATLSGSLRAVYDLGREHGSL
jgi:hypothetical protein